jgi:hypothetical protein
VTVIKIIKIYLALDLTVVSANRAKRDIGSLKMV